MCLPVKQVKAAKLLRARAFESGPQRNISHERGSTIDYGVKAACVVAAAASGSGSHPAIASASVARSPTLTTTKKTQHRKQAPNGRAPAT
ncbi:unnamed protein product, partial [Ectocarpus sp. 4 AP-2014]